MSEIRVSINHFLENTNFHINNIAESDAILIIDDDGDRVVMMSYREYENIKETLHILSSSENTKRLFYALKQAESGELQPQTVDELFEEIEKE